MQRIVNRLRICVPQTRFNLYYRQYCVFGSIPWNEFGTIQLDNEALIKYVNNKIESQSKGLSIQDIMYLNKYYSFNSDNINEISGNKCYCILYYMKINYVDTNNIKILMDSIHETQNIDNELNKYALKLYQNIIDNTQIEKENGNRDLYIRETIFVDNIDGDIVTPKYLVDIENKLRKQFEYVIFPFFNSDYIYNFRLFCERLFKDSNTISDQDITAIIQTDDPFAVC